MEWQVIDMKNKAVGKADLPEKVFGVEGKDHLFYDVVRYQLAARRQGTHKTKTRSEVRGGGAKPYRQKGTGRARRGTNRSPLMPGGGRVFGPVPRDYSFKLNRKIRKTALAAALSRLVKEKRLFVVESFDVDKPSTKAMVKFLEGLKIDRGLVVDEEHENLYKSVRNLPRFKYLPVDALNVYDVLKYDNCVISRRAIERIKERLGS